MDLYQNSQKSGQKLKEESKREREKKTLGKNKGMKKKEMDEREN